MRWAKSCFLAAGAGLIACAPPAPPARAVAPSPAPARPPAAVAQWPDVARDVRSEKSGAQDAALVVAVERRANLPDLRGVRVSGEDWARFFPNVLGVPPDRVTALFDAGATRLAIASAVRATAARVAPGGRLWFVAIGYAGVSEADVAAAADRPGAQVVSVLDVVPSDAAKLAGPAPSPTRPGALPPITFSIAGPAPLPDASRPALSYLLMGALRGWGDRDQDGRITAAEAAAYVDLTLGFFARRGSSEPSVTTSTALVCSQLTTLSVAREPAPNVMAIAPRAIDDPPGPVRWQAGPNETARQLYNRAEQENDATLSRCTWSAVAEKYAQSWWTDPEHFSQVEPALNGAYALRKLGRTDDAAALYRAYVSKQGGARAGESDSDAKARRSYAVGACAAYLAIAKAEPRHFSGYFDTCRNVDCTGLDRASCAELTAGAEVPLPAWVAGESARAWQLALAAQDRQELAGWELTDKARADRLREASERYAAAEAAWAAVVDHGAATPDPAEAARRLAEAAVRRLGIELEAGAEVTDESVENARKLARRARDISSDERRVEPARLLVELADGLLAREHRAFVTSHGERGVAPRSEVRLEGELDGRHAVSDELPVAVAAAIAARDEYLASVAATFDAGEGRYRMAYEAGRFELLYGHFAEARQRLELPYAMQCRLSPVAHEAWMLLVSMANLQGDATLARSLASDAAVCPFDVETRIAADRIRKPVGGVFFLEGRYQLELSEALPDGPQRRARRREAAAILHQSVGESPDRDEAPEAALQAADAYAELDENARAIEMYRVFVDRYGALARVRVADVEKAYAALAMLHARLGDYRGQARVLVEESERKRLPAKARAAAARKARELRTDRDGRGLQAKPTIGG